MNLLLEHELRKVTDGMSIRLSEFSDKKNKRVFLFEVKWKFISRDSKGVLYYICSGSYPPTVSTDYIHAQSRLIVEYGCLPKESKLLREDKLYGYSELKDRRDKYYKAFSEANEGCGDELKEMEWFIECLPKYMDLYCTKNYKWILGDLPKVLTREKQCEKLVIGNIFQKLSDHWTLLWIRMSERFKHIIQGM